METDCGVYKMPKCKALKSGLRLENAFSAFSLVPLVQGFFSSFGVVNHEPSKVSGVSSGHMSVGRTKRPVWELRSLRQEGDRIILLFLQARWMHVLKWAAQNVPKWSKECCAVLSTVCEEFGKACCGLYRAHSSSDLLTTSPTRLLQQPMMRRQGMDNYPVPVPLPHIFRYRST